MTLSSFWWLKFIDLFFIKPIWKTGTRQVCTLCRRVPVSGVRIPVRFRSRPAVYLVIFIVFRRLDWCHLIRVYRRTRHIYPRIRPSWRRDRNKNCPTWIIGMFIRSKYIIILKNTILYYNIFKLFNFLYF